MERKKGRSRRVAEAVAVLALLGVTVGLLVAVPRAGPADRWKRSLEQGVAPEPKAELHLSVLTARRPDLVLELEYRNAGQVPIEVERDLMSAVELYAVDARGGYVDWEVVPAEQERANESPPQGRVTLGPRQSLKCKVNLTEGFATVSMVRMWLVDKEGQGRDATQAIRTFHRLPPGSWPVRVGATCKGQHYYGESLEAEVAIPQG